MVIQKAVLRFVKYNNMRYTVESQCDVELNNSSGAEKGNDVEEHVDWTLFF